MFGTPHGDDVVVFERPPHLAVDGEMHFAAPPLLDVDLHDAGLRQHERTLRQRVRRDRREDDRLEGGEQQGPAGRERVGRGTGRCGYDHMPVFADKVDRPGLMPV